jgi:ribosome-binding protein aMBF1 (putative translation factor)
MVLYRWLGAQDKRTLCGVRATPRNVHLFLILKVRRLIVINNVPICRMGKRREAQLQKQFGERVRELRKHKGLSQEALALACALDRTYIGSVERGERNISLINIHRIAEALGVSGNDLLQGRAVVD